MLGGELQAELVPGLQKDALGLHQTLAHRPIGGLAEVAPLGVLHMGPPGHQRDAQIRDGGPGEHAGVAALGQVGEDEPLPVPVQHVLSAGGEELQAAAPRAGLQQQVDLRVVPQGLKVTHPLHRRGDGLPVDDAPCAEADLQAEPLRDEHPQDLQLDLPHELDMDLPQRFIPDDMELGVLLLELPELQQRPVGVAARGQQHLIGEHRLQSRGLRRPFTAQALAGIGAAQAGHRAHRPRRDLLHGPVSLPGINADLVRLLLPDLLLPQIRPAVGQQVLHPEAASGDLQVGEAPALGVPGDLIHPGPELRGIVRPGSVPLQPLQQRVHPLQAQRGAK